MAELQQFSSHEGPSEEGTCLDRRCRGQRGAEGSIQCQSSPKIPLAFLQSCSWGRNSFHAGWEFQGLPCLLLTAPNWAAPLAPCACSKGDFALWEWNVGLQSPCAADICYFCPEECCIFSPRKEGAPVEQHRSAWGLTTTHRWSGMCPQLSHELNSCQDFFPHRGWIRLELTQLSRKLFLSCFCGFQTAALAVTNPAPASHC